ncbi:Hypothetical predicted protein [Podarcis lilfordi]|uniref:Coiled-coil glutamate rich protein 1 n=1 Tax=Podarcis lilfordi TaxID=74358 RepID=A0AA35JYR8_9SAUR|nr:Hypothetical predicted protein [Podarcis lilfordi]
MLRRQELLMCGKGVRCWDPPQAGRGEEVPEGAFSRLQPLKERGQPRRVFGRGRPSWHHRRRGRNPSSSRAHGRQHYYQQQQQQAKVWPRCYRPTRPRVLLSLRPVNMMGKRAPGMRAPRNTNQFLMREKYQLMHLRSDSVGTESGGSDCEMDPLDMDSYLGVLENARGALMDCPSADGSPSPARAPTTAALLPPPDDGCLPPQAPGLRFSGGSLEGALQEESLQYFPSEDDVIESEIFMERDFHEFCSSIA